MGGLLPVKVSVELQDFYIPVKGECGVAGLLTVKDECGVAGLLPVKGE